MTGGIVEALIVLVVIGVVWYLIVTFIPMPAPIKTVITVVAVLLLCIWMLNYFGITNFDFGRRDRGRVGLNSEAP